MIHDCQVLWFSWYGIMCSFNIGLFSLFIATASLSSASYFDVKCDFGVAYYATNTSVLVNGSLTSNFSHARNCHVMYNKSESALIRVAVGRLNASSNLRALYSMIIENVTVLFVGVAHLHDLANSSKYYFHACPQGHTQQDLDILFFGSPEKEAIDVKIELDPSVLTPGEPANLSVKPNGLANVTAFDIENEHNLTSLIQILVSSNDDKVECLLMVSQSCSSMQSQGLAEKRIDNTQSSIKLTFTKSGAITLSQYSKPKIATGRWYIGISCKSTDQETTLPKNVAVTVKKGYTYDMLGKTLPIAFMCIIAVIGGISIAVFAHFFLNPDFGECSFSCHDHLEVTQNRNRSPSTEMSDCCREPLPRGTFLFKEWFKVIFLAWFGQGIKTYSYLTAVLAISFMVGSAQFVIARWSSMIEDGNRDLCYYNELCYRPIAIADMPSNFMLSNVPYIIHGVLLALSFSFREAIKQEACSRSSRRYSVESARLTLLAPYDYSVAYALSWALIFEGLFSATYHLCPSRLFHSGELACAHFISRLEENTLLYWGKDTCKEAIESFSAERQNFEHFLKVFANGLEAQEIATSCKKFLDSLPQAFEYFGKCISPKVYIEILELLLRSKYFQAKSQPVHRVEFLCLLGQEKRRLGDKTEYNDLMEEAHRLFSAYEDEFETKDLSRVFYLHSRARFLSENSYDSEPKTLYDKALEICEKKLPGHPETAVNLLLAGRNAKRRKKNAEATEKFSRAFSLFQKLLGDHLMTAQCLKDFADFIFIAEKSDQGLDKALEYYEKAMEVMEKLGTHEHKESILTLKNYGICHRKKGNFEEAEKLLLKAELLCERELENADHTWKVMVKTHLGLLYHEMTDKQENEESVREGLLNKMEASMKEGLDMCYRLNNGQKSINHLGNKSLIRIVLTSYPERFPSELYPTL